MDLWPLSIPRASQGAVARSISLEDGNGELRRPGCGAHRHDLRDHLVSRRIADGEDVAELRLEEAALDCGDLGRVWRRAQRWLLLGCPWRWSIAWWAPRLRRHGEGRHHWEHRPRWGELLPVAIAMLAHSAAVSTVVQPLAPSGAALAVGAGLG